MKMEFDLKFDYAEALKRHNLTQPQVDSLRESAKNYAIVPRSLTNKQVIKFQPLKICLLSELPSFTFALQLCLFLNACDGDVDRALQMAIKHYEIRKKAPQLFTKRDPKLPELVQCLENQYYLNMTPTPGGQLICLFSLANQTAKNYVYDESTKCFLMMIGESFETFSSFSSLSSWKLPIAILVA